MSEQLELIKIKCEACLVQEIPLVIAPGYVLQLLETIGQLQFELGELKPQALLLRQFLNNAHADIEQLAVENKRLQVELEKNKTYEKQ